MENYRENYADAFIQRCLELSDEEGESTGNETFLCTWLWRKAKYSCSVCKKEFYTHRCYGWRDEEHADICRAGPQLEMLVEISADDEADDELEDDWDPELCVADCCVQTHEMSESWAKTALAPSPQTCPREAALIQVMAKTPPQLVADGLYEATRIYYVQGHYHRVLCYSKDSVGVWDRRAWPPTKDGPILFLDHRGEGDGDSDGLDRFAKIPMRGLNPSLYAQSDGIQQHGGTKCDVFTKDCSDLISKIKPILSKQAKLSNDRPIPKYQNIIDPNLFVRKRKSDDMHVWVPSEFDISSDGSSVELVAKDGHRAHYLPSDIIDQVATPVLQRSLPLLARLKRPYILLEGQRLQVAVKAQRIETRKRDLEGDDPFSSYQGLWHVDGVSFHVVVSIYDEQYCPFLCIISFILLSSATRGRCSCGAVLLSRRRLDSRWQNGVHRPPTNGYPWFRRYGYGRSRF